MWAHFFFSIISNIKIKGVCLYREKIFQCFRFIWKIQILIINLCVRIRNIYIQAIKQKNKREHKKPITKHRNILITKTNLFLYIYTHIVLIKPIKHFSTSSSIFQKSNDRPNSPSSKSYIP